MEEKLTRKRMTIDEAISRIGPTIPILEREDNLYLCAALKLGIEALKYVQRARQHDLYVKPERLPGETK